MSGSFTGFSAEDIRKLATTNTAEGKFNSVVGNNKQDRPVLKPQQKRLVNNHQTNDEIRNKILNEKIQNSPMVPIVENAKLNKAPEIEPKLNTTSEAEPKLNKAPELEHSVSINDKPNQNFEKKVLSSVENFYVDTIAKSSKLGTILEGESSTESNNENETKKEVLLVERKIDLDEFQAKQKLIEEQNRKRKELLVKALAVKTKQTQEETRRLNEIREEFKKLDALLSNDVKILRQEIEIASLDYMEAQKRYFRVEKEFLDLKMVLHQKLERKEMLTEHLCTIIEKNEERKAEKLNELLLKLNLGLDLQNDDNDKVEQTGDNAKQTDNNLGVTNDSIKSDNSEEQ